MAGTIAISGQLCAQMTSALTKREARRALMAQRVAMLQQR
jgi:hypothetical protein